MSLLIQFTIWNLGITFDAGFTLDNHFKFPVWPCFYNLRNKAKLSSIVSCAEMGILTQSFVSSCLDLCNTLCLTKASLDQNVAARLFTKSSHFFSWLHCKCSYIESSYIFECISWFCIWLRELYMDRHPLTSDAYCILIVPHTKLNTKGDIVICSVTPRLWNSLPPYRDNLTDCLCNVNFISDLSPVSINKHLFRRYSGWINPNPNDK